MVELNFRRVAMEAEIWLFSAGEDGTIFQWGVVFFFCHFLYFFTQLSIGSIFAATQIKNIFEHASPHFFVLLLGFL